ncbi:hypothetical protein AN401_07255 [Zobellella denitrificans]|uniref:Uncharacterized protein n=1 Tax=Zobellella denitrificans TaxID=347534 RepID=A0A291HNC4_9GAMM|nr:hypothetical protein [Zobellella denitrificans]ATG73680.1 hypothetical protein AN401_07255 [Zobellella denitrificans]
MTKPVAPAGVVPRRTVTLAKPIIQAGSEQSAGTKVSLTQAQITALTASGHIAPAPAGKTKTEE